MHQLRLNKQHVALAIGLADLGGVLATMDVTKIISDFADATINCCMQFCLADLESRGRYSPTNPENIIENSGMVCISNGETWCI